MNFTRQKKLFLLILTLAGICPAIYCADHEGADIHEQADIFEPNINLPLEGEAIYHNDGPMQGYDYQLGIATASAIYTVGIGASYYFLTSVSKNFIKNKDLLSRLPSIVTRDIPYFGLNLIELNSVITCVILCGSLSIYLSNKIRNESRLAIDQWQDRLDHSIINHNRAVSEDPQFEGMIIYDEQGNRTLSMRGDDQEVHEYPFDRDRQERQANIRGLVIKFLLGPENLRRIRSVNERLNALDSHGQLNAIQHVKPAKNK